MIITEIKLKNLLIQEKDWKQLLSIVEEQQEKHDLFEKFSAQPTTGLFNTNQKIPVLKAVFDEKNAVLVKNVLDLILEKNLNKDPDIITQYENTFKEIFQDIQNANAQANKKLKA